MLLGSDMRKKINIGVLISGGGSNLQAIMDACDKGSIHGKIVFVGSDNPAAKGLERAKQHEIPCFSVDYGAIARQAKTEPSRLRYPQDLDMEQLLSLMMATDPDRDHETLTAFLQPQIGRAHV